MSQWVCHISGQGEKWECDGERPDQYEGDLDWCVKNPKGTRHWLPKSEYRECDPPEEWEDVTRDVEQDWNRLYIKEFDAEVKDFRYHYLDKNYTKKYRLRKVQVNFPAEGHTPNGSPAHCGWAFIVERKKS